MSMMLRKYFFLFVFLIIFNLIESISIEKIIKLYCEFVKCDENRNVVCETSGTCTPSSENCFQLQLDMSLRKFILHKINTFRSKMATGQDTRYGNSQAANMFAVSYDSELEFVSQCSANNCNLTEEICAGTSKYYTSFEIVGSETIRTKDSRPNKSVILSAIEKIFSKWYNTYI